MFWLNIQIMICKDSPNRKPRERHTSIHHRSALDESKSG